MMKEDSFESNLIQFITSGQVLAEEVNEEQPLDYVVKTKLWKYEKYIKTTDQLWNNFKQILEQHNQDTLDNPLSIIEFNQVKRIISNLHTPYQAGQFLYGLNGVSQIEIDLDDGKHVFLTVFDQKQIGAGNTVYQVVNQIERPAIIAGKKDRRFDTTLLINGLPIIQIEEKRDTHDVDEALNQMHQYIDEAQYTDIFSTLQILIAMTPNNIKYMANTTTDKFNKAFAFNWQRRNNSVVYDWREFADSMLSIPMAHQMATNYMILDGTKNKQMLKVMRPYQVYATQNVMNRLKQTDFDLGINKVGYVWHTTGSGKTITSFKTAWLASRLPNVDKVVFVVDRKALIRQTNENYRAYDPDLSDGVSSSIYDTKNTTDLSRKLKNKSNGIIVTSTQKLQHLIQRKSFKSPKKNIVFIVDEAHRSTGGASFGEIQRAFKHSAWIGYTGTPMFDDTTNGLRTEDIFGPVLHEYTIKEAIADKNVLGFKVDFETTIDEQKMKTEYLPNFYQRQYPEWTPEKIQNKIDNLTQADMDDKVEPSFYDENPDHVRLVVEDIFKNWRNRSNEGRYNALLTTHVGGGKASVPMAVMYFKEFQRVNELNSQNGKLTLKVAVTFSEDTSNSDSMLSTNHELEKAMKAYNDEFNTSFDLNDVSGYTQDVVSRLNKTAEDHKYLDIVIVVEQLLTGFDAPELNTLYVDRTLKGANLIQAYSRSNRIADMQEKPWGRIVNYRWPAQNEKLMNKALAIYANKDSANLSKEVQHELNTENGIIAEPFEKVFRQVQEKVNALRNLTDSFEQVPNSEQDQEKMMSLLREYNSGMAKLKQFDPEQVDGNQIGFDYDNPDELIKSLGMTTDQESKLTTALTNELKEKVAKRKNVSVQQIELKMTHVKDVKINYDYLTELIEKLLNQVHEKKKAAAKHTQDKINYFAKELQDRHYADKIVKAANAIIEGLFPPVDSDFEYPAKVRNSDLIIQQANDVTWDRVIIDFKYKWGISEIISSEQLRNLFSRHHIEQLDLDDTGQLRDVIAKASDSYRVLAHDISIQMLSRIKYRNALRDAIYALADQMVENE